MSVLTLNGKNFEEEVLKADKPVIVDFYADWCGPCQMMSPVIDEIAEEKADSIKSMQMKTKIQLWNTVL